MRFWSLVSLLQGGSGWETMGVSRWVLPRPRCFNKKWRIHTDCPAWSHPEAAPNFTTQWKVSTARLLRRFSKWPATENRLILNLINNKQPLNTFRYGLTEPYSFRSVVDLIEYYQEHSLAEYNNSLDVKLMYPISKFDKVKKCAIGTICHDIINFTTASGTIILTVVLHKIIYN